jgi:hypothetical protein
MRKLLIAAGCVAVLGVAGYFALPWVMPWYLEMRLATDCSAPEPSDTCVVRMRAMGHVQSARSSLGRAEYWYRRAADRGDPSAMFHLGWLYETRALDQFRASVRVQAERMHASGTQLLDNPGDALASLREAEAIAAAVSAAEGWYRKAAEQGSGPAMNNLGELYRLGIGRDPDARQAVAWYMAAARAGSPLGTWNVAFAYMSGQGVGRDAAEAEKWLVWSPPDHDQPDLKWPTLERTTLFGSSLPAQQMTLLRAAARAGGPVRLAMESMQPNAALPSFRRAATDR